MTKANRMFFPEGMVGIKTKKNMRPLVGLRNEWSQFNLAGITGRYHSKTT